ncbi:MAG: hypothetical protein J6A28_03505 [Clostridia bacterium]|nr:hypothetical protein [Clostridia bacterium]
MKEKNMQSQETLKSKKFYSFKMAAKRITAGIVVGAMLLGTSLGFVGCLNDGPDTDLGLEPGFSDTAFDTNTTVDTNLSTDTDTEIDNDTNIHKPPVDVDTGLDSDIDTDSDDPIDSDTDTGSGSEGSDTGSDSSTPPAEDDGTTFEQFINNHGEVATQFALDQIGEISYIDNSLSTSYKFIANNGKIEGVVVANVVKTGQTTRELKIATINFAQPVDIDDIIAGDYTTLPLISSQTALAFDAKEEYNNPSSTIEQRITEVIEENLGENYVEMQAYEKETYKVDTVAELVATYPELVNEILNEKCFDGITAQCIPLKFDANKIADGKWYLEGESEISGIGFVFKYNKADDNCHYYYGKALLKSPIAINDFINKQNITIDKYTNEYIFTYIPSLQEGCTELMNAIFKAAGLGEKCPEGAVRLFKDGNALVSDKLGEARSFIVVEISADKIIEIPIAIQYAQTDSGYILNLKDKSKYVLSDSSIIEIQGVGIEYDQKAQTTAVRMRKMPARRREDEIAPQSIKRL